MKSAGIIFRFRFWVFTAIFFLGFWAPLDRMGGVHPGSTWLFLAGLLARYGILSITYSSIAVMGAAILFALLSAMLRTWGAAYLGPEVVRDRELRAERVVADGPYRYVRHPLYVGLWLHTLALSILMPPGGALFTVIAIAAVIAIFVRAEESRLTAQQGETYLAYQRSVPAFFASPVPRVPANGERPRWGKAFLGEIYLWGVCVTYIGLASRYNVTLLEQGVLISLGISIMVQGLFRPSRMISQ